MSAMDRDFPVQGRKGVKAYGETRRLPGTNKKVRIIGGDLAFFISH